MFLFPPNSIIKIQEKYTEAGSYILINSKLRQGVDHLFSLGVLWTIAQQVIYYFVNNVVNPAG